MKPIHTNPTIKLNNGVGIPLLGLGTYKMSKKEAETATLHAIKTGYRHIDTATRYDNEDAVGRAVKESRIKRKDIFITTKLWNGDHNRIEAAFNDSLKNLGMEYVDLYLMHWPVENKRLATWKIMEKLYKSGKCRSIGVSNFTIKHLTELIAQCDIIPVVNQVEFNPFLYQKELWDFCKSHNIQLEAYSPLTHAKKLKDRRLAEIASHYDKTSAQLLIRWCIQKGIVVIPKSTHPERIEENNDVFNFEITKKDMELLDDMNENLRTCWNPESVP